MHVSSAEKPDCTKRHYIVEKPKSLRFASGQGTSGRGVLKNGSENMWLMPVEMVRVITVLAFIAKHLASLCSRDFPSSANYRERSAMSMINRRVDNDNRHTARLD